MCGINERQILKTRLSRLLRMSKLDFLAFFVSGLHCSHEQSEKRGIMSQGRSGQGLVTLPNHTRIRQL